MKLNITGFEITIEYFLLITVLFVLFLSMNIQNLVFCCSGSVFIIYLTEQDSVFSLSKDVKFESRKTFKFTNL